MRPISIRDSNPNCYDTVAAEQVEITDLGDELIKQAPLLRL